MAAVTIGCVANHNEIHGIGIEALPLEICDRLRAANRIEAIFSRFIIDTATRILGRKRVLATWKSTRVDWSVRRAVSVNRPSLLDMAREAAGIFDEAVFVSAISRSPLGKAPGLTGVCAELLVSTAPVSSTWPGKLLEFSMKLGISIYLGY